MSVTKEYSMIGCKRDSSAAKGFTELSSDTKLIVNPTASNMQYNLVCVMYQDFRAHFNGVPTARKKKLIWKFDGFEDGFTTLEAIMKKIDDNAKAGYMYYHIRGWCPGFGWIDGYYYVGSPISINTAGVAPKGSDPAGTAAMATTEIHWIEAGNVDTDTDANLEEISVGGV